jgi:hypothetical protein
MALGSPDDSAAVGSALAVDGLGEGDALCWQATIAVARDATTQGARVRIGSAHATASGQG